MLLLFGDDSSSNNDNDVKVRNIRKKLDILCLCFDAFFSLRERFFVLSLDNTGSFR